MKFEKKDAFQGIIIGHEIDTFSLGVYDGFWIQKENTKQDSYTYQKNSTQYFDYHGIENALVGVDDPKCFTTKRITVIQME